jgi:hypothetical protein
MQLHNRKIQYIHVKSHIKSNQSSNQFMNNEVDLLAKLARSMVEKKIFIPHKIPSCRLKYINPSVIKSQEKLNAPITIDELETAIKTLHKGSPGADNIPPAIFHVLDTINRIKLLQHYNNIHNNTSIPDNSKKGRSALLYKSGDPALMDSWRGLNIGIALNTIYSKILVQRLLTYIFEQGILSQTQKCNIRGVSGVREHSYLIKAIIADMHHKATLGISGEVIILFTDIKKAFDSVSREILLQILKILLGSDIHHFYKIIEDMYTNVHIVLSDINGNIRSILKD